LFLSGNDAGKDALDLGGHGEPGAARRVLKVPPEALTASK
jgi:hypothetical protein